MTTDFIEDFGGRRSALLCKQEVERKERRDEKRKSAQKYCLEKARKLYTKRWKNLQGPIKHRKKTHDRKNNRIRKEE